MKYMIEIEKIKRTTGVYEFEVDSKEDMYKILDYKHPSIFGKCIEKRINEIKEYPIREVK